MSDNEIITPSVYEQGRTLTSLRMLVKKWEEEIASRQRPLTGVAEMMKHCAAEIRHLLPAEASDAG